MYPGKSENSQKAPRNLRVEKQEIQASILLKQNQKPLQKSQIT